MMAVLKSCKTIMCIEKVIIEGDQDCSRAAGAEY